MTWGAATGALGLPRAHRPVFFAFWATLEQEGAALLVEQESYLVPQLRQAVEGGVVLLAAIFGFVLNRVW